MMLTVLAGLQYLLEGTSTFSSATDPTNDAEQSACSINGSVSVKVWLLFESIISPVLSETR